MDWPVCTTTALYKIINTMHRIAFIIITVLLLISCSSTVKKQHTLRDIDVTNPTKKQKSVFTKPKTDEEIRRAYSEYLKFATKDDGRRLSAITRLAQLEFELGNRMIKEKEEQTGPDHDIADDAAYNAKLDKTIELLTVSLKDYSKSKDNDKILYQLAKAYDQRGNHKMAIASLQKLADNYPKSPYYIESQFRLGEEAFSRGDYVAAEDAYTQVIGAKKSIIFYEKSLFKRGWSRFKQEYYLESVEDYLEAVKYHEFGEYAKLIKTEKDQFNEYFRAIGLAFSYLGGSEPLNDYLKDNPNYKYVYYTYSHISDIYLKQERYSDSVETLNYYIARHPKSENIPIARLKIIEIWQKSGFTTKVHDAIETLYVTYNPDGSYWTKESPYSSTSRSIVVSLKKYVLLSASHFHTRYRSTHSKDDFKNANKWYKRYVKYYSSNARKDNIYNLYAELLAENNDDVAALHYYELAAYNSDLILNKDAAYATIVLTNKLLSKRKGADKNALLDKHINYVQLFTQMYPGDKKVESITLRASELAYTSKNYSKTLTLTSLLPEGASAKSSYSANILKAQAYFDTSDYSSAEETYRNILSNNNLNKKDKRHVIDKLALSIYKQAVAERENNNINLALNHFLRISRSAPSSSIAATGMYDAIALSMSKNMWDEAISYMKVFQSTYPDHKLNLDVTKKLSLAYLKSNQEIKAAREFERISSFEQDNEVKIAALWQAAELYESKQNINAALRSYEELATKFRKPHPQHMEAMFKVTELYKKRNETKRLKYWQQKIIKADRKTSRNRKTDRTKFIASVAALNLAKAKHMEFRKYRLVLPLKKSLRNKKRAMQSAVKLYGQASMYGISQTATEATHSIAELYRTFSKELLESERPKFLKGDELEQYVILLEDRAFPFEEKAIEFFETNLSHIKDGVYNDWVKQSHARLKELFPVRYNRGSKIENYINVLH